MVDQTLNQALTDVINSKEHLDRAKTYLRVMSEAGQDVSKQRADIAALEAQRQKYIDALKNNGAVPVSANPPE